MSAPQPSDVPELPRFGNEVTLLETSEQTPGALHAVVLDHILSAEGGGIWIDSNNRARTHRLTDIAPSGPVLERVHVARAFTAYQHYSLVEDVSREISADTEVMVLPMVDWFYSADELRGDEGTEMLESVLKHLRKLTTAWEIPVVVTRSAAAGEGEIVGELAQETVDCIATKEGPRFVGGDFETLVYHRDEYMQTTLAYWREILATRHQTEPQPQLSAGVTTVGPN